MIRYLLWGLASLHLVIAIGGFGAAAEFHRYHSTLQGDELAGQAAALAVVLFAVVELVVAIVFATLAVLTARVITFVVGGLALVLGVPVAAADVYDAAPWFGRLVVAVTTVAAALTVSALALLAFPRSRLALPGSRPALPRSRNLPGRPPLRAPSTRGLPGKLRDLGGVVTALALVLVAGGSTKPVPVPPAAKAGGKYIEPPHQVVYLYTVPAAKPEDRFVITYLDASGRKETITQPGYPPAWVELIRLPPGATALELFVRSSETSSAPMIQCRIQVDGRIVRTSDGNPCRVRLTFPLTQEST